jgi:hypothetical protein
MDMNKFEELLEDYAGAVAETAVFNATQRSGITVRMTRPRRQALLDFVKEHLQVDAREQEKSSTAAQVATLTDEQVFEEMYSLAQGWNRYGSSRDSAVRLALKAYRSLAAPTPVADSGAMAFIRELVADDYWSESKANKARQILAAKPVSVRHDQQWAIQRAIEGKTLTSMDKAALQDLAGPFPTNDGEPVSVEENKAVNQDDWTPNTCAGFHGGFYALHRRVPTEQEVWDAGVKSGMSRARSSTSSLDEAKRTELIHFCARTLDLACRFHELDDGTAIYATEVGRLLRLLTPESLPKGTLTVWYGSMPESNGKSNWTAILHRGDISEGYTIDRSEYPDQVRFAADEVRFLIGELKERPWILDYDTDKCDARYDSWSNTVQTTMAEPCDKCGLLDANNCTECNSRRSSLPDSPKSLPNETEK